MSSRQELEELRRLDELERKLASQDLGEVRKQKDVAQANVYAGDNVKDMGSVMRGLGGAKVAWDRAAMGLKEIFTDLTPEDQALLDQGKAFMNQGGTAATVGGVAGDIAITAAPAMRAQRAIMAGKQMLPKAMQWMSSSIPAAVISGGVTSAALTPENRGTAAIGGALGAGVGETAGRVLTKTLGGLTSGSVTPEARAVMDQGAFVPMWKATDSKILRNVAERARALPVSGSFIKGQERAGIESWNKILVKEATPPMPVLDDVGNVLRWESKPVTATGTSGLNQLAERFEDAYAALYGNRGVPVDDVFASRLNSIVSDAKAYLPGIADDVAGAVRRAEDTLMGLTSPTVTRKGGQPVGKGIVSSRIKTPVTQTIEPGREVVPHTNVTTALDDINNAITAAYKSGNGEKAETLQEVRSAIESLRSRGLPPEVQSQAADINKAYAKFKTLERAAGSMGAQKAGGVVTPQQQLSSIKARDKTPDKSAFARGNAPGQQQALQANQVFGSELPEVGPGTAEKLLPLLGFGLPMIGADFGATALLGTQSGQKFLMGQLPGQAGIRKYGDEYLVQALRQLGMQAGN